MFKQAAVYILASKYNGTLYIGVTSNLPQRMYQHREEMVEGFSKKYGIKLLVYVELCDDMVSAKRWLSLIEQTSLVYKCKVY